MFPKAYLYLIKNKAKGCISQVGTELGDSLVKLANAGLKMNRVHLLGHSLGAHIMAYAGKRSRERGHVISR